MSQGKTSDYPKAAGILALVGGIIILLGGVLFIGVSTFIIPHFGANSTFYGNITLPHGLSRAALPGLISGIFAVMGSFGLICGAIVLLSASMVLAKVGKHHTWGILILIFSILSFIGLGGFVLGAILGIVGGVLALRWRPPGL